MLVTKAFISKFLEMANKMLLASGHFWTVIRALYHYVLLQGQWWTKLTANRTMVVLD